MSEQTFIKAFLKKLKFYRNGFSIGNKINALYALTIEENGSLNMGVDEKSGEIVRGKGSGFEQDIMIYQKVKNGYTTIIPRVIIEVKFETKTNKVTTHDAIIYSEKAKRIRTIYPYVRFGFLIGGCDKIPPRIIRLGTEFDFIKSLKYPFNKIEIDDFKKIIYNELKTSLSITRVLKGKKKIIFYQKTFLIK